MKKILIFDSSHVYSRYLYNYLADVCDVFVITKSKHANQFVGESFDFFYFILHSPEEILTLLALQNTITSKSLVMCSGTSEDLKNKLQEFSNFYYIDLTKPKQELLFTIKVIIKSHI